jgi:hypothetical protein
MGPSNGGSRPAFAVPFAQGWTGEARGRHCEKCSRMWLARHQRTGEDYSKQEAGSREAIRSLHSTQQGSRAGQGSRRDGRNATPLALGCIDENQRAAPPRELGSPKGRLMPPGAYNSRPAEVVNEVQVGVRFVLADNDVLTTRRHLRSMCRLNIRDSPGGSVRLGVQTGAGFLRKLTPNPGQRSRWPRRGEERKQGIKKAMVCLMDIPDGNRPSLSLVSGGAVPWIVRPNPLTD